jgi:hypothetical protein
MTNASRISGDVVGNPHESYELAIEAGLRDLLTERQISAAAKQTAAAADERGQELITAVTSVIALLPPDRRQDFRMRLQALLGEEVPVSTKGSEVYDNVVDLLTRQPKREITTAEVKQQLSESRPHYDPKAVDNVLGYLAKSGKLQRVGRGRYRIRDHNVAFQPGFDFEGRGMHEPEGHDE